MLIRKMTASANNYEEYARLAVEQYERTDAARRTALFEAVKHLRPERVLDVGCGAGQQFFGFLENSDAHCFGVDIAPELGAVTRRIFGGKYAERTDFIRSKGERLPFESASFDVAVCLVALPYMNNRAAIAEIARVLKPRGAFVLKIHAPAFYLAMIGRRMKTFNPKQIAYPLVCLAGSVWHVVSGRQLERGFWRGKEIFQTRRFLRRELEKNNLKIVGELPDSNFQSPSFMIVKKH